MDLVHLIELIGAWEERLEGQDLVKDAAYTPVIHLVVIIPVGQEALGRPVPPRADVLGKGWLAVDPAATAEVGQFDCIATDQNVLRLDVTVVDADPVHVVDGLQDLVDHDLHAMLGEWHGLALDRLVHVAVHELEDESQAAGGLIV